MKQLRKTTSEYFRKSVNKIYNIRISHSTTTNRYTLYVYPEGKTYTVYKSNIQKISDTKFYSKKWN